MKTSQILFIQKPLGNTRVFLFKFPLTREKQPRGGGGIQTERTDRRLGMFYFRKIKFLLKNENKTKEMKLKD